MLSEEEPWQGPAFSVKLSLMKTPRRSLLRTSRYLKNKSSRDKLLLRLAVNSSLIEGLEIPKRYLRALKTSPSSARA